MALDVEEAHVGAGVVQLPRDLAGEVGLRGGTPVQSRRAVDRGTATCMLPLPPLLPPPTLVGSTSGATSITGRDWKLLLLL
jgi:hypothetical protein